MPKGIDWINFTYVNLGFISQVFVMYYFSAVAEIKKNWPKYRCNPMFMPLSNDIEKDFVYCVQNMQTNFMGYLLQPINYIITSLSSMGGDFGVSLNYIYTMLSSIRSRITSIIQSVFGVFLNLIIEFQKITIGIKDLVGKIIGIMATLMYMIDGSIKTLKSTWNGPPGQMIQALSGNCFKPDTKIKLMDGSIVEMQNLNLGDILENGSRVDVVMKVDNKFHENYYVIPKKGAEGSDIYVTGTHMIFSNLKNKYIEVKDYPEALATNVKDKWFTSIITDDHKIKIGSKNFWDWEDDILKYKKFV
jgi:hypothetical protein